MKNFIFRMISIAIAAIVFVGCSNGEDPIPDNPPPSPPDPPTPSADYVITIDPDKVMATTADGSVVPKDKSQTYFFNVMTDNSYKIECGGDEAGLKKFVEEWFKGMAELYQIPMSEVVAEKCYSGDQTFTLSALTPNTKHVVFALGIDESGKVVDTPTIVEFTTKTASGTPPELTLMLDPGDTDSEIIGTIYSDISASIQYGLWSSAEISEFLGQGLTYGDIIAKGKILPPTYVDYANSESGVEIKWSWLEPDTEYCFLVQAMSATGASTLTHVERKTTGGDPGEPLEDYDAWLGTWTVVSTSSEISKKPITFEVSFREEVLNLSYKIVGWSISSERNNSDLAPIARFNMYTKGFYLINDQELAAVPDGSYRYSLRFFDAEDRMYYLDDAATKSLIGTISSDGRTATVVGGDVSFSTATYVVSSMDIFYWKDNGEILGAYPADGFIKDDYPIGPYTLTKKVKNATAQAGYACPLPSKAFDLSAAGKLNKSKSRAKTTSCKITTRANTELDSKLSVLRR